MKKNLTVLILFLTVFLSLGSQTSSTTINPCGVPCRSLRNALKVKERADYLDTQLVIARDSISVYQEIVKSKDSIILYRKTQVDTLKQNENHYKEVIKVKDSIIEEAKYDKKVAYIFTTISLFLGILLAI